MLDLGTFAPAAGLERHLGRQAARSECTRIENACPIPVIGMSFSCLRPVENACPIPVIGMSFSCLRPVALLD
jgi:hypothetical protein